MDGYFTKKPPAMYNIPIPSCPIFRLKDPGSALTHLLGLVWAVMATPALLIFAAQKNGSLMQLVAFGIFLLTLIGLYAASTAYHSFNLPGKGNEILKKLDHTMIFFLIAGTYTPLCLTTLAGQGGEAMLIEVWAVALCGTVLTQFWVNCPKWVSSLLYIAMGWLCVTKLPVIFSQLDRRGFWFLLAGGVSYTVGGVIYALRLQKLNALHPNFGSHEIFHLFVLAGSFCQYATMFYL